MTYFSSAGSWHSYRFLHSLCTFLPVNTVVMCETVFTQYKPNPDFNSTYLTSSSFRLPFYNFSVFTACSQANLIWCKILMEHNLMPRAESCTDVRVQSCIFMSCVWLFAAMSCNVWCYTRTCIGFTNISFDEHASTAEKCVQQILYQLEHLSKVWRPVLPTNVYQKSMGN